MGKREQLMNRIEKERMILDGLLTAGAKTETIYCQSLVLDELIEEYMDLV